MSRSSDTQRLPRFVRHRFRKPAFVLQGRDIEIVRCVHEHRFIASDELQLLTPGSNQRLLRRLQRLFHHGFLDRPQTQRAKRNGCLVYGLGQRGAELLDRELGRTVKGNWSESNRRVQLRHLEHALMASRFQTAVRHSAECIGSVVVERWLPDGAVKAIAHLSSGQNSERIPIRPDAVFVLNVLNGKPGRIHACVEVDRSTMDGERFERKLRGYFEWWRSGQAERVLGAKNFLVVTVTRSPERADLLRERAGRISKRGLRMFLFACERQYLPARAAGALKRIWRTPADQTVHALTD